MPGWMRIERGNITELRVDAIVNAANEALLPGGGVCGAIHRAAGPALWGECRRIGHCAPGEAVITGGYNLPARWVVHTVGPVWEDGTDDEAATLARCYTNSLRLAADNGVQSIAFPAISTGIYGFPHAPAARIAVETVRDYLHTHDAPSEVLFCVFAPETEAAYSVLLPRGAEQVGA